MPPAVSTRRIWLWIIVGGLSAGAIILVSAAGAGMYFISHHVEAAHASGADAISAFDAVLASLHSPRPLYEIDADDRLRVSRAIEDLPTGSSHPQSLRILTFDPDDQRLVHVSLPFWMLRLTRAKFHVTGADRAFDLRRLNLDGAELQRIGPALVLDFRDREGARVLLWTQ
jgi:hypothetical protein